MEGYGDATEILEGAGYKLRKAPKRELYWVVSKETGKKHSKEPLPLERAKAQMRALYVAMKKEGGVRTPSSDSDEEGNIRHLQRQIYRIRGEIQGIQRRIDELMEQAQEVFGYIETYGETETFNRDLARINHQIETFQEERTRAEERLLRARELYAMACGGEMRRGRRCADETYSGFGRPDEQIDARAFQLALAKHRGKSDAYILALLHEMVDDEGNKLEKSIRDSIFAKYQYYLEHPEEMELTGQGDIPARAILWRIAKASYSTTPESTIDVLTLVSATPTLKFYKDNNNTIVVGIRGTKPTEMGDLKADGLIGLSSLAISKRYKKDLADLVEFQKKYPPTEYDYYGVGHSLGGAILDEFIKGGYIKNGVSYNPAVQPSDWKANIPNKRVYMSDDPLYLLMGKHTNNPEVRSGRKKGLFETVLGIVPSVGKLYGTYQAHALDNFKGGGGKLAKQISDAGMTAEVYLRRARQQAKKSGYDPKRLELSNKKSHKLMYKTEDGKVVHFGRAGYGDFIIWSALEHLEKTPKGTADKKRRVFHSSHSKIKGDWRSNPHSANNLALKILW